MKPKISDDLYYSDAGRCETCGLRFNTVAALLEHEDAAHKMQEFDGEKQRAFFKAIGEGYAPYAAARKVGTTPGVIDAYKQTDIAFVRAIQRAEAEAAEKIEQVVYDQALEGTKETAWASKLWLKKRSPERWEDKPQKIQVEHSGNVSASLEGGSVFDRILQLQESLEGRAPEIIDVEVVDEQRALPE